MSEKEWVWAVPVESFGVSRKVGAFWVVLLVRLEPRNVWFGRVHVEAEDVEQGDSGGRKWGGGG